MKKWNEIKNEPITWGGYMKFSCWYCVIILIIYAIAAAAYCGYYYADVISEKISNTVEKVKAKFRK